MRYSLIAITLVLVSSFSVVQISALGSSQATVASSGAITYFSTNWYGVDFFRIVPISPPWDKSPLITYKLVDFLNNINGVNSIRFHVSAHTSYPINANDDYGYFSTSFPNTKTLMQQDFSQARAKGMKTILAGFQDAPMATETDRSGQASIILNTDGYGDNWVKDFAQMITDLHPDAVEIMNEPLRSSGVTFQDYRNFVVKASTAFRKADPNVSLVVGGYPFWNLNDMDGTGSWATKPLTEFSDVTYAVHLYYDTMTLGNSQWAKDYNAGNLAKAKTELYNSLLGTGMGLQALIDKNLKICWTEAGVETGNLLPHWDAFLKDMYDFAKQYNQGFIQNALGPYPPDSYGILTSDWLQLNKVGQFWAQNFLG